MSENVLSVQKAIHDCGDETLSEHLVRVTSVNAISIGKRD
jgi:hypothetical protein